MTVEFYVVICRKNLEEAQEKFRKLYSDYQMVVKELQNFHEEQKDRDRHNNAYLEVQARGFTEKIDSMTAQLLNMEEALAQKEKEVTQLKETVEKCELEKEAVTILKAQVWSSVNHKCSRKCWISYHTRQLTLLHVFTAQSEFS